MHLGEVADLDIAILGAGREGRAVWRWLRKHFPHKVISIYDEGVASDDQKSLFSGPVDRLINGSFDLQKLSQHELLIRSPGISPYRKDLSELRNSGMKFSSASNLWFAANGGAKTICITGTKGKSTTAALVAHLLQQSGLKVQLAGNIGKPLLDCDEEVDWWVIELSSYQIADLEAQPTIAAIINLSDEHLDWHGDRNTYQQDKLRLAKLSKQSLLVANRNDDLLRKNLTGLPQLHWFGEETGYYVKDETLHRGKSRLNTVPAEVLRGRHNLDNLAAALTIVELAGVRIDDISAALQAFSSLPHRLQTIGKPGGIQFINDSLSTTPVSTLAALEAFKDESVILLVGGLDRGVDWRPYIPQMKVISPKAIICLPDSGETIAKLMAEEDWVPPEGIRCATNLVHAMEIVAEIARAGDTVLLSPGAPSFPQFKNYEERGKEFARLSGC